LPGKRGDGGKLLDVDDGRIERLANPLQALDVAFVVGIGDGFEDAGTAPGTAGIFGWASPLGFGQARIDQVGYRLGKMFDLDRMLPDTAEVVEILQALRAGILEHIEERRTLRASGGPSLQSGSSLHHHTPGLNT
jgi:hypothetical protein